MHLAVGNPPVLDPRSPLLAFGTSPFVHVGSICSIHIATDGTLGLVRILPMIGPRNAAMTAALLVVRIQVADFYRLVAAFLPLNLHIDAVHIDLLYQRLNTPRAFQRRLEFFVSFFLKKDASFCISVEKPFLILPGISILKRSKLRKASNRSPSQPVCIVSSKNDFAHSS